MKLFIFVAFVLALVSLSEAAVNPALAAPLLKKAAKTTLGSPMPVQKKVAALQQAVIKNGGCRPNVCFALDGSGSISDEDYRAQQDFVLLVSAIIGVDIDVGFSAVQYGLRNIRISPLTKKVNRFLRRVDRSSLRGAPRTFIAAGLGYCIRQLRKRKGDANKIVLFGDGRSNFGGNPVPIADIFRPPGAICAVGIGFQDTSVLEAITGTPNNVLAIDGYFEMIDILDDLVEDVCGFRIP